LSRPPRAMSRAWIKPWRREAQSGLGRPAELYADGGYISGLRLQRAARGRLVVAGAGEGEPPPARGGSLAKSKPST